MEVFFCVITGFFVRVTNSHYFFVLYFCVFPYHMIYTITGLLACMKDTFGTQIMFFSFTSQKLISFKSSLKVSSAKLKLREHPKDGPYVENLTKHLAMKYIDILGLMERGNKVRTTASTNMNDTSRSAH